MKVVMTCKENIDKSFLIRVYVGVELVNQEANGGWNLQGEEIFLVKGSGELEKMPDQFKHQNHWWIESVENDDTPF